MIDDNTEFEVDDPDSQYQKYIDKLDDIKIENQRLLARNTLIISGGAFTLSLTLLKDVYTSPLPWTKGWLVASWILFGLCGFLQFYSDLLSSWSISVQRKNFEACYPDNMDQFDKLPNRYTAWVRLINSITPWLICVGFISMIVFNTPNFISTKGNKMKNQSTCQSVQPATQSTKDKKRGVEPPDPPRPKEQNPPLPKPKPKPKSK